PGTAARASPLRGDGRKLGADPAGDQTVSYRSRAGHARPRPPRPTACCLSAGAAQNPGVQLAPGAASSAAQSGVVALLARRSAGPHLAAPVVVAVAEARALGRAAGISRGSRQALREGTPPRGRALALSALPALPRRRGTHLQSAARNLPRVRCRAFRLPRRRGRAWRPGRLLRARGHSRKAPI